MAQGALGAHGDLALLDLGDRAVALRRATPDDLGAVMALLAEDQLGEPADVAPGPDGLVADAYLQAFAAIDADPTQLLVVGEEAGEVVATMQLTFIPGLLRRGATRTQIEAVRVRSDRRGAGIGAALIRWAVEEARRRGAGTVQLTSDKRRVDAHHFYRRLGFSASHEGFKLHLPR